VLFEREVFSAVTIDFNKIRKDLKYGIPSMRWEAVSLLSQVDNKDERQKAIELLEEILKNEKDRNILWKAITILSEWKVPSVIPYLAKSLEDNRAQIRRTAAEYLISFAEPTVVPRVLVYLSHSNPEVREIAIKVLSELGNEDIVPEVKRMLNDECFNVQFEAAIALKNLGDLSGMYIFYEGLRNENPFIRIQSLWMIAENPDKEAIEAIEYVANYDPNEDIREEAKSILEKLTSSGKKK
jgi:HEAT repeat protein